MDEIGNLVVHLLQREQEAASRLTAGISQIEAADDAREALQTALSILKQSEFTHIHAASWDFVDVAVATMSSHPDTTQSALELIDFVIYPYTKDIYLCLLQHACSNASNYFLWHHLWSRCVDSLLAQSKSFRLKSVADMLLSMRNILQRSIEDLYYESPINSSNRNCSSKQDKLHDNCDLSCAHCGNSDASVLRNGCSTVTHSKAQNQTKLKEQRPCESVKAVAYLDTFVCTLEKIAGVVLLDSQDVLEEDEYYRVYEQSRVVAETAVFVLSSAPSFPLIDIAIRVKGILETLGPSFLVDAIAAEPAFLEEHTRAEILNAKAVCWPTSYNYLLTEDDIELMSEIEQLTNTHVPFKPDTIGCAILMHGLYVVQEIWDDCESKQKETQLSIESNSETLAKINNVYFNRGPVCIGYVLKFYFSNICMHA